MTTALEEGRRSYERQAWGEAFDQLSAAEHDEARLEPDDLDRLAMAATSPAATRTAWCS